MVSENAQCVCVCGGGGGGVSVFSQLCNTMIFIRSGRIAKQTNLKSVLALWTQSMYSILETSFTTLTILTPHLPPPPPCSSVCIVAWWHWQNSHLGDCVAIRISPHLCNCCIVNKIAVLWVFSKLSGCQSCLVAMLQGPSLHREAECWLYSLSTKCLYVVWHCLFSGELAENKFCLYNFSNCEREGGKQRNNSSKVYFEPFCGCFGGLLL